MSNNVMPRNLKSMAARVEQDPDFRQSFLANPQSVLDEAAGRLPNTTVYHWVVGSLGLALITCLLASVTIVILYRGPDGTLPQVPDIFVTATSTIIGALAGLLIPQS